MKNLLFPIIFLLMLSAVSFAQTSKVKIVAVSYGKNPGDVKLTIANKGEVPIKKVTIYVDGNPVETFTMHISKDRTFVAFIHLSEGKHEVIVETDSGATDRTEITIGRQPTTTTTIELKKPNFQLTERDLLMIGLVVVIVILGIAVEGFLRTR